LADAFFFAGARSVVVTQWQFSLMLLDNGAGLISRSVESSSIGVAKAF
jgi:hypothetical protein